MNSICLPSKIYLAVASLGSEQRSEWDEAHASHDGDWCSLIAQWTPEARRAVEIALHDYALASEDARDLLIEISAWSRRLGVWLACRVARQMYPVILTEQPLVNGAIEASERWVLAESTEVECMAAASGAYSIYVTYRGDVERSAFAAYAIAKMPSRAYHSAVSACVNISQSGSTKPELRRRCIFIAEEIAQALDVLAQARSHLEPASGRRWP